MTAKAPPPDAQILAALRRNFGFSNFRPGQAEAVKAALSGRHSLVVMPVRKEVRGYVLDPFGRQNFARVDLAN